MHRQRQLSGGVDKNAFSASELITICKQLRIKGKSEKNGFTWDPPAQRAASWQDSQGHVRLSALLPVELPTPQLLPLGGIFHSSASGSLASLSHVTSQALSSRERWTPAQGIFQYSHHKQLARPINSHCESPLLHTVESVLKEPIINSQGEGNALLSIHGMSHSQTSEQDAHPCQQLRPTSPGASSPDRFSEHSVS